MRIARETWIGVGAFALATAAMAIDHLVGTDPDSDDSFPVDPATFFISVGVSALLAALLFAWVVPRGGVRNNARAEGPA